MKVSVAAGLAVACVVLGGGLARAQQAGTGISSGSTERACVTGLVSPAALSAFKSNPDALRPIAFPRQALHALRLSFVHPRDSREMRFEAPLPEDLAALVARLRRRIT